MEDDPEILNILRDICVSRGHRVVAEARAKRPSKCWRERLRPGADRSRNAGGERWEIAKQTKAKNPKTPVVMITGWGAQYEEENLASRGVD